MSRLKSTVSSALLSHAFTYQIHEVSAASLLHCLNTTLACTPRMRQQLEAHGPRLPPCRLKITKTERASPLPLILLAPHVPYVQQQPQPHQPQQTVTPNSYSRTKQMQTMLTSMPTKTGTTPLRRPPPPAPMCRHPATTTTSTAPTLVTGLSPLPGANSACITYR